MWNDSYITATELVYQLGHLNQSTVMQYYAEVRTIKLAELNSEFFKAQFDILLSKEQLTEFPEEERRLLYVDFRLGNRRVELGFCTRKLCEGACKSRSRTVHCVNCPQLCTGRQYIPHWRIFRDGQETSKRNFSFTKKSTILYDGNEKVKFIINFLISNDANSTFKLIITKCGDEKINKNFGKKFVENIFEPRIFTCTQTDIEDQDQTLYLISKKNDV